MPDDPYDPDDSDMDQDDGDEFAETKPCPFCGKPVYEQAEACPNCGQYISEEDSSPRKPLWIVVSVGVCVAIILIVWVVMSLWHNHQNPVAVNMVLAARWPGLAERASPAVNLAGTY